MYTDGESKPFPQRMNRRSFLLSSIAASASGPLSVAALTPAISSAAPAPGESRVGVLLVDTDRVMATIDQRIYGQFLEHINHSVEDGLFAEQIRGAGFEGERFQDILGDRLRSAAESSLSEVEFQNGKKSVRLTRRGWPRRHPAGAPLPRCGTEVRRLALGQAGGWLPAVDAARPKLQGRSNRIHTACDHGLELAGGPPIPSPAPCATRRPRSRSRQRARERCSSTSSR